MMMYDDDDNHNNNPVGWVRRLKFQLLQRKKNRLGWGVCIVDKRLLTELLLLR
jgi:hypothetical protein